MTEGQGRGARTPEQQGSRPEHDRRSAASMTSTTTGLPERYRPLEQVGPDEPTPTGVIRCWRAKDRVLNRDVAIRVHTPAGPAAHDWITRALTAGGLATPALAMVYDASEGSPGPEGSGSAAYVVNEWIDGETLADRLTRGPLPERETRLTLRRLAEGVAEAHRVGLAVGGLTVENVVLRPNGLVGLRSVPAATGTMEADVTALGDLLEACLTGRAPGTPAGPLTGPSDLVALARRARSAEPGQGLTSVAAMAALLAERPRSGVAHSGPLGSLRHGDESDSGWLRRLRERRTDADHAPEAPAARRRAAEERRPVEATQAVDAPPVRLDPQTRPPVPLVRPVPPPADAAPPAAAPSVAGPPAAVTGGDTVDVSAPPPSGPYAGYGADYGRHAQPAESDDDGLVIGPDSEGPFGVLSTADDDAATSLDGTAEEPRRRLVVVGLPLLALAVVIGIAFWVGNNVLSVAGSVGETEGSTPSAGTSTQPTQEAPPAGPDVTIVEGSVFDPFGDGEPENDGDVPLSHDGDPETSWSTLHYRGSPAFGNLKPGVGVVYDLGSEQELTGVTLTTTTPGISLEVRAGDESDGSLDSFDVLTAADDLEETTELSFDEPVTTRFLLVWVTGLTDGSDGFSGELAEVVPHGAG
jgi:hypothetical protein